MKPKLSNDEKEILTSFENEEWKSVKNFDVRNSKLKQYARATLRKDKRVNIRISQRDLKELQRKAVQEGLPYQTLISSILHKYVNGNLTEKKAA
jgi:predicted DNA binding CopG/RHH family protein